MSADDVVKLFKEIGFPAAVAAFVLWRLEARLREMVEALHAVKAALATVVTQAAEAARELAKQPRPDFPGSTLRDPRNPD